MHFVRFPDGTNIPTEDKLENIIIPQYVRIHVLGCTKDKRLIFVRTDGLQVSRTGTE